MSAPRPTIEPVGDAALPEFAAFLHRHLQSSRSAAEWEKGLRASWLAEAGNHGFVLRQQGEIVGGIGAYYSERQVRGRAERFCNLTSWCVLDAYRQQSVRLGMALLSQPGYHFTNFSPTPVVASTLRFLKFKDLDSNVVALANVPGWSRGAEVVDTAQDIEARLQGEALRRYRDHAGFPWLRHVVFGRAPNWCHAIYKPFRYKGLPAAEVLYVGERDTWSRHWRALATYLLARGLTSTHVEARLIGAPAWPSALRSGFGPKLYRSDTLEAADIDALYSETVALDL